jgi:hypothetical protein
MNKGKSADLFAAGLTVTTVFAQDAVEPIPALDPGERRLMKNIQATLMRCVVLTLAVVPMATANVVTDWNAIASTTIVKNGGKGPGAAAVWFSYTSLAVYDAVNAITGQYRPFYYYGTASRSASIDAAVAAAAHRVLVNYFPSQRTDLDAQFAASLSTISPGDSRARDAGVAVGEAAAAAIIAARRNDGLEANVPYSPESGPGVWTPTPPAYLPAATPWLGQMRPFTMVTASDFRPAGPTPLASERWKRDYTLTRILGGADSTMRLPSESEIAIFWTEHTAQQFARLFKSLVQQFNLSVADSARMMAMLWTGSADAIIGCFDAKYTYNFWRPVAAYVAGGANLDLNADLLWSPLATTPNHPEFPSGHNCFTGAVTTLIAGYFGSTKIHLAVESLAFQDGPHTHTFEDTRDMMDEVFWARLYAGFHFYHSLEAGRDLGVTVARALLRTHFGPQGSDPDIRVMKGDTGQR